MAALSQIERENAHQARNYYGRKLTKFVGKEELAGNRECLFNQLPEPIVESIFNRLESKGDRGAMSQVCKMWHRMDGLTRKSVYISNCYSIAPSGLSRRFKNLEKIKIKGKPRAYEFNLLVDDWGGHAGPWILEIAAAYPKLQGLSLRRMDVEDEDLQLLAMNCPILQKLKLHKCSGFTTAGLKFITQSCRNLRILDIEESDEIEERDGTWLQLLQKGDGGLESLNIASAGLEEKYIKEVLPVVARSLKSISSLKVSDMELCSFFKILDNSDVPVVELGLGCYSSVGPDDPKELAALFSHRLSKIKVLDLKFATLSAEIQIELLRHCHSLEELELRSAVGDRGMQVIGESCKQLKRIRVDQDTSTYMTQKGMIAICEGCRELDFLVMYLSDVNNEALAAVGRCLPKLTDFRIVLLEGVVDNVADLPLDDGVRSLLQGCPMLTRFSVYLRAGGLSDTGMAYIGEFGAKLKWVLLGCSGASDQGLRRMAEGCRQLERLELRGCPFSAEQLASSILTMLTRLKYLWVQGFGATVGLGVELVSRKPGFLVEFMAETQQILGYYTVAHPRRDNPASVCLMSLDLPAPPEAAKAASDADPVSISGEEIFQEDDAHATLRDHAHSFYSPGGAYPDQYAEMNVYPGVDVDSGVGGYYQAGFAESGVPHYAQLVNGEGGTLPFEVEVDENGQLYPDEDESLFYQTNHGIMYNLDNGSVYPEFCGEDSEAKYVYN